jgi:hypothetical protein
VELRAAQVNCCGGESACAARLYKRAARRHIVGFERIIMRAETERTVEEIQQAIALLRRHR